MRGALHSRIHWSSESTTAQPPEPGIRMMIDFRPLFVLVLAASTACSSDESSGGDSTPELDADASAPGDGSTAAADDAGDGDTDGSSVVPAEDVRQFPENPPTVVGGERPADVVAPLDYDPARSWPVILLLHGYGASGFLQDTYLGVSAMVDSDGFIVIRPDGTRNADGQRFWNGPTCCNFEGQPVDDVAYLRGLVEEVSESWNIDPDRVYAMGHSNGGFMSYRLACEASDVFVAIASLAGSTFDDPDDCAPAVSPVSVLQVHGTNDDTISYDGGNLFGGAQGRYPSARQSVETHAAIAGCAVSSPAEGSALDLEVSLPGDESTTLVWTEGCTRQTRFELWTIPDGSHLPNLNPAGTARMVRWLLEQRRTP